MTGFGRFKSVECSGSFGLRSFFFFFLFGVGWPGLHDGIHGEADDVNTRMIPNACVAANYVACSFFSSIQFSFRIGG